MSDTRDPDTDQPLPKPGGLFVQDIMLDDLFNHNMYNEVREAIRRGIVSRRELGIRKYGTALQINNGRDALLECWQEALDLLTYSWQMNLESGDDDALVTEVTNLVAMLTERRLGRGDQF